MNTNIVGCTNVRLLKNISAKVERVVKRDCLPSWFQDRKLSPRSLMLGIYVAYHNACKRARDMEKAYQQCRDYNGKLQAEIERLKEFEKMAVYSGYSAVITTYHWSCGDGCCSDSWCYYQIYDQNNKLVKDTKGYSSENSYRSYDSCEREIKQVYGSHVKISGDDDYSGTEHERY